MTVWHPVIVSFRDKKTRALRPSGSFESRECLDPFPRGLKLDHMEAATSLRDLAALPGNRFEVLVGDRKGQHSIRINDQWRDLFRLGRPSAGTLKHGDC